MGLQHESIGVDDALDIILQYVAELEAESTEIDSALDRSLAEDIISEVAVPPFDNAAMDGYAVRWEDVRGGAQDHPASLAVAADLPAGDVPKAPLEQGTAVRIMTGAPVPPETTAVVPFEDTRQTGDVVAIFRGVSAGQNIRRAGEDVVVGERILAAGTRLRPQEIGVLASLGIGSVDTVRQPKVGILTTGNELVGLDEPVGPGKIRDSNQHSLRALVSRYGGVPIALGRALDDAQDLVGKIRDGLKAGVDLILTCGGVSAGDYDLVKEVLDSHGEMRFWQVRMTPGRPLAFGRIGDVPLIGLPGNPVAVMVSFEQFARPAILKMLGRYEWEKPSIEAILMEDVKNRSGRRRFVRVAVAYEENEYRARPTGDQGSGILTSMVRANGLLIVPEGTIHLPAGSGARVQMLDWPEEVRL
jgi:molybdopterin molybdotransferase